MQALCEILLSFSCLSIFSLPDCLFDIQKRCLHCVSSLPVKISLCLRDVHLPGLQIFWLLRIDLIVSFVVKHLINHHSQVIGRDTPFYPDIVDSRPFTFQRCQNSGDYILYIDCLLYTSPKSCQIAIFPIQFIELGI